MSEDLPEPGLPGFSAPASPARAAPAQGYRVLARKYRPNDFSTLIGQEGMVRTLKNAFASGRIPQAWMLAGVRGVGKTSTARILARALNYESMDGRVQGPTIELAAMGRHCQAIIESRHIDVMEMDAASHTGVADIRQIIESVPYAPVEARYKVFIIDEVHMLSNQAFNALLKTLEEPPPHVKFVFATTEIRKVPVTILSRCQRFDLRRVEAAALADALRAICLAEGVEAEDGALAQIARAAEGSVRDSQSLLDQAIAHGGARVTADVVRAMLGLVDRGRLVDMFEAVMAGRIADVLDILRELYGAGSDPAVIIADLAEFTHLVTRLKLVPSAAGDGALTEVERTRGAAFAAQLGIRALSRAWQILLKAVGEVQAAPRPVAAAEMALVRLAYAAELPAPDEIIRALPNPRPAGTGAGGREGMAAPRPAVDAPAAPRGDGAPPTRMAMAGPAVATNRPAFAQAVGSVAAAARRDPAIDEAPPATAAPGPVAGRSTMRLEDLAALARSRRDMRLALSLEQDVRLVRLEEGRLEFTLAAGGARTLANDLSRRLQEWTGRRWVVALVPGGEAVPTLREKADTADAAARDGVKADPLVAAVLSHFPGATIQRVVENRVDPVDVEPDPTPSDIGENPTIPFDDLAFDADSAYTDDDS